MHRIRRAHRASRDRPQPRLQSCAHGLDRRCHNLRVGPRYCWSACRREETRGRRCNGARREDRRPAIAVASAVADAAAPNTNRLSSPAASVAAGTAMRSAMPAASAASKSIIHFMPSSMAIASAPTLAAAPWDRVPLPAGERWSRPRIAIAGRPPDCHDGNPAIGHESRERRAPPCGMLSVVDRPQLTGMQASRRQRLTRSHRRGSALLEIRRLEHAHDPRGARIAETIGELTPRGRAAPAGRCRRARPGSQ